MDKLYIDAQTIFKKYREAFIKDTLLQKEFLDATKNLLSLYDTKFYENRFIV